MNCRERLRKTFKFFNAQNFLAKPGIYASSVWNSILMKHEHEAGRHSKKSDQNGGRNKDKGV